MKVRLTESQIFTYFNEVMSEMDSCSCVEKMNESISPSDQSDIKILVKKEIKDFLDINRSSDLERKIGDIVKRKFKDDKDIEKYIVNVTKNVLIQLYKTLWTRRSFWSSELRNQPN